MVVVGLLLLLAYLQLFYDPCGRKSANRYVKNESTYRLVIANEGSHFKDSIARILVRHYESEGVKVEVIPMAFLPELNTKDYTALVVLHSWYTWNPPPVVEQFIKEQQGCLDKITVMTTSAKGSLKMDEVEAITGASRIEEAAVYANQIMERIDSLLGAGPYDRP